ncbi:MAG: hypothetical protein LUD17_14070, partial [Bacteroidales bacterium]|nr:hypothetical protein [Bacteroidales bacterium]
MAAIDNLLERITNLELRAKLQSEIARMQQDKHFGLVFEEHLPDATLLYEVEVRRGQKVTLKNNPLKEKFEVVALHDGLAECVSLDEPARKVNIAVDNLVSYAELNEKETKSIAVDQLLPFADFGDPIYPYLQSIDKISTAPDSSLWHEVIEAENYHALQLLTYLYPGKVDCIYIDPPYNKGTRDWKYNNDYVDANDAYRHSKWLSMMKKRLLLAKKLLNPTDSVLIVTIDEMEYVHLGALLEELFPNSRIQMISSVVNPKGVTRSGFRRNDEYIYFIMFGKAVPLRLTLGEEWSSAASSEKKETKEHNTIKPEWTSMMRRGSHSSRKERSGLYYSIYVDPNTRTIKHIGKPIPLGQSQDVEIEGLIQVLPLRSNRTEGCWQVGPTELETRIAQGRVRLGRKTHYGYVINYLPDGAYKEVMSDNWIIVGRDHDNSLIAYKKEDISIEDDKMAPTQWKIASHNASENGSTLLGNFLGGKRFDFPKSLYAVHDTLRFFVGNKPNALILDFFAGSGTTLHAVNLLNAEDGGNRRCIIVTNNEVGETEELRLKANGKTPMDKEWSDIGIARYVTWPRTLASIKGKDVREQLLPGEYLTYLMQEKEMPRRFKKVSYVRDIKHLTQEDLKDMVSNHTEGKIAKNKIKKNVKYIVDKECDISILLDEKAVNDWLDELDGADHIKTFIIVTQDKK